MDNPNYFLLMGNSKDVEVNLMRMLISLEVLTQIAMSKTKLLMQDEINIMQSSSKTPNTENVHLVTSLLTAQLCM